MSQRPIAIIGMACRFPQADDIAAFWRNIRDGRDCIGPIPPERWHPSQVSAGLQGGEPSWRLDAGIVADADSWDAKFFGISDGEARRIDPQQGLVLESAWHACEDANLVPASLTAVRTGVYIGVSTRDFDRRSADDWQGLNVQSASGSCGAVVANRLSYALGLTGPSLAIDTACASSLTAIHMACRALDGDECEMALAGGVQLIMSPTNIVAFSRDRVLAKSGGCKPFSKNADGYVFGEGVGMLLLKPLDAALKDGDHVRAVILGSAVNHNGRSNGLSAPYGAAMQDVMRRALERAGVTPQEVDYVEAHAVGTPIGDAIEVQAVKRVYGANRDAARPCRLGSVKSNIGHLEAASGVASLIKAALALENGMMPASLHCDPPSPALRLDPASMRICDAATAWESEDRPRRAGVSAFGFGGANAHVVLAESPVRPATVAAASTVADPSSVLMLSANDEAAFARLCRSYRKRLAAMKAGNAALCGLRDFCHTAALTRQHHQFRRALQVRGWDDAIAALETALPVRTGKAVCRIGIRTACSDVDDAADAKARRSGYVLGRALAVFGITQVQVDNATAPATAILLADHAARMDLACAIYREEHPPFVDCVILTEAGDPGVRPDLIWREGDTASQQLLELVSMLFEKGFELAADGLAAAIPGNRIQLPLYPFERRRHHALSDTLARAETSALPHVSNLTV